MGKFKLVAMALLCAMGTKAYALKNSQAAIGNSSTFNVFLKADGVHKGESYVGLCNGSLIAPDLVVTAAHCVAGSVKMLDKAQVSVGNYVRRKYPNGNETNYYYKDLDVIGVKRVIFPKHIDQKIRTGTMTGTAAIKAPEDIALIVLERPVDLTKVPVQLVNIATANDYKLVAANPSKYQFIVVSTNIIAESGMDTKRYAPIDAMKIDGILNKAYKVPMWSTDTYHQVEEGDSGAPLLVNISGQWKLFAVTKGTKRDALSANLEKWTGKDVNITPELNIFTPVTPQICGLLKQANRSCN